MLFYPDRSDVFEEFSHFFQSGLLCQSFDVDSAVLRVVLLFRAA